MIDCIHGLGPAHILIDLLLLLPFGATLALWWLYYKKKLNDFLVLCQLKYRVGVIIKGEIINVSMIAGAGICTQSRVDEIEYKYYWKNPFKKVINAKKKKTPFEKHSNPICPKGRK